MSEDIKGILDNLIRYKGNAELNKWQPEDILTIEDVWLLLDYITNLQQYYNDNVNKYEELLVKYSDLQEEIERLNNIINEYTKWLEAHLDDEFYWFKMYSKLQELKGSEKE